MSAMNAVTSLRDEIDQLQEQGYETIAIDPLLKALNQAIERGEHTLNYDLTNHAHTLEFERNSKMEMFKSVITTGQSALRAAMLLNGGAAVAMLAFVGKLVEHSSSSSSAVATAVFLFAIGALLGAMATGSTYLSQMSYAFDGESRVATVSARLLHVVTVFLVASSLIVFAYGAWSVAQSVKDLGL